MRTLLAFLFILATASAQTHSDPKAAAYYAEHKDFFHFATPADLPKDLVWQDGSAQKEFADSRAVRGGTLRQFTGSTPPTLRRVGPKYRRDHPRPSDELGNVTRRHDGLFPP